MNSSENQLEYISRKPDNSLTDIVESIWMVKNVVTILRLI